MSVRHVRNAFPTTVGALWKEGQLLWERHLLLWARPGCPCAAQEPWFGVSVGMRIPFLVTAMVQPGSLTWSVWVWVGGSSSGCEDALGNIPAAVGGREGGMSLNSPSSCPGRGGTAANVSADSYLT